MWTHLVVINGRASHRCSRTNLQANLPTDVHQTLNPNPGDQVLVDTLTLHIRVVYGPYALIIFSKEKS